MSINFESSFALTSLFNVTSRVARHYLPILCGQTSRRLLCNDEAVSERDIENTIAEHKTLDSLTFVKISLVIMRARHNIIGR